MFLAVVPKNDDINPSSRTSTQGRLELLCQKPRQLRLTNPGRTIDQTSHMRPRPEARELLARFHSSRR